MNRVKKGNPVSGWLVLDKPLEISSARAVAKVKRILKPQKIGHAGTLDPLASGILPLALGEATKTVSYLMSADKGYDFSVRWGQATATDDAGGGVIAVSGFIPDEGAIRKMLPRFIGTLDQAPPVYSALKVAGERAYKLARKGDLSQLPKRQVVSHDLRLVGVEPETAHFSLTCGKGFYVRSLARDLGEALGTKAHVVALRRTHVGPFGLDRAISLAFLDGLADKASQVLPLLPIDVVLDDIPVLTLSAEQVRRLRFGQALPVADFPASISISASVDTPLTALAKSDDVPVGLVELDQISCRARRLFNL